MRPTDIVLFPVTAQQQEQSGGGSADNLKGFKYWYTDYLYYKPEWCNCPLTGTAIFNHSYGPDGLHDTYDFFGMGQVSSVTPLDGAKLKKVYTSIRPNSATTPIEYSPTDVQEWGDNGTFTLIATLNGNVEAKDPASGSGGGGGLNFSVGRTWNVAKGEAGGSLNGDFECWASQFIKGGGSSTTKSAQSVSTWKVTRGQQVGFTIGGHAKYKK